MIIKNKFLINFFTLLNNNNINYCVLRNYEGLPNSLNGSDLDILISGKEVKKFYTCLNEVLNQTNGKIIIQYGKLTPRICIAGIANNVPYGLQLDIHEGILPYKTEKMFPVDFLLSRVKRHNDILVANDDDADLIAFLKEILNNDTCKEKYFNDAKATWSKNKSIYIDILLPIYNETFISLMNDVLDGKYNLTKISNLAKKGQGILTKKLSVKVENLKSKISRYYRFFNPPGFTIAVLGTDGAGKTTIIDAIRDPLREAVHNSLFYEHMRPNLIPNIAQLFGKEKQSGPVATPHSSKPSGIMGSLLRFLYYSFDYIVGYWVKIYPVMVKKSSIWIFDRYYYDYLVDQKRARINLPVWIIKGMEIFIPKPNLILCLGAEPNVIHNRKPELPLNEVVVQVNKLKSFCDNEKKAVWIDTGTSLETSINKTFTTIIDKMTSRYN